MKILNMEFHLQVLHPLCRLCVQENPVAKSKEHLRSNIQRFLKIDISKDDSSVHPPSICELCRRKLSRCKSSYKRSKSLSSFANPNIALFDFKAHSGDCELCTAKEWNKQDLLKFCQKEGFHSWMSSDGKVVAVTVGDGGRVITKRIVLDECKFEVYVLGKLINLKTKNPVEAIKELSKSSICIGNHEFQSLAQQFAESGMKGLAGQTISKIETFRHVNCKLFLETRESSNTSIHTDRQCPVCKMYKPILAQKQKRGQSVTLKKQTKHSLLARKDLVAKVSVLQKEKNAMQQKVRKLQRTVEHLMDVDSIIIMQKHNEDCFPTK